MDLFKANSQWATRPEDERFTSLPEMYAACKGYADSAATSKVPYSNIRVEAVGDEVQLTGRAGKFARMTHWSFGQLSRLVGAPADYLRTIPATLAVQNLNWGLKDKSDEFGQGQAQVLFHQNGELLCRALTSEVYTRIWNHDVVKRLLPLQEYGWQVPPARPAHADQKGTRKATKEDVLRLESSGLSIKVGDLIAPAGLYASDHDMFAFMVNEANRINDGTDQGLGRGFFVENSEVGAGSFRITTFLYRFVCGNHIVWGASNVNEIRIKHVGSADTRAWGELAVEVRKYSESSVGDLETKIVRAKKFEIAANKEDVLDYLFKKKIARMNVLEKAYDMAEDNSDVDGSPRSAWGFAQGMTRLSQDSGFADKRTELDRAAGKVIEIAF